MLEGEMKQIMKGTCDSDRQPGVLRLLATLDDLKQMGYKHPDARHIWCPDWLTTNADLDKSNESKALCAKSELRRMKSVSESLALISKSLEDTIKLVNGQSSDVIRFTGFSSLPDDVLARVFELHHRNSMNDTGVQTGMASVNISLMLASVCTRFRRIVLHIPNMWSDVSNYQGERWIANVKERSRNPVVFVTYFDLKCRKAIPRFLRVIHPASQWKGLHVRYHLKKHGHNFFNHVSTKFGGDLSQLEDLSLLNERPKWQTRIEADGGDDGFVSDNNEDTEDEGTGEGGEGGDGNEEDDDDDDDENVSFMNMPDSSSALVSTWVLPKLSKLTLSNTISSSLKCPNLKACYIRSHQVLAGRTFHWDLRALHDFLRGVPLLELLSLGFLDSCIETHDESLTLDALTFACPLSLEVNVDGSTDSELLTEVMGMIDPASLSSFKIKLSCIDDVEEGPGATSQNWIDAIFDAGTIPGTLEFTNVESATRLFPNLERLHLELAESHQYLHFHSIYNAVPRVRDLSFKLPGVMNSGILPVSLGSLKDLRSLHLQDCNSYYDDDILKFFKIRSKWGKLENIESINIEGCYKLRGYKRDLEALLGDKFIWRG